MCSAHETQLVFLEEGTVLRRASSFLLPSSLFHLVVKPTETLQHPPLPGIPGPLCPFCLRTSFSQELTARFNNSKQHVCIHNNLIKQINVLSPISQIFCRKLLPQEAKWLVPSHPDKNCPKPGFLAKWSGLRVTLHHNSISSPLGLSFHTQADYWLLVPHLPLIRKDFDPQASCPLGLYSFCPPHSVI